VDARIRDPPRRPPLVAAAAPLPIRLILPDRPTPVGMT
jgi:hypothetical protein